MSRPPRIRIPRAAGSSASDGRPRPSRRLLGPLLLVAAGAAACDNPVCVFAPNGCEEGAGGGSSSEPIPAVFPDDGAWLVGGPPTIVAFAPTQAAHPSTPIVIQFSESVSLDSLDGAFELVRGDAGDGGFGGPPAQPLSGALVGDGRVAVLFPQSLEAGVSYSVQLADGALVTDLSGDALADPGVVGTFAVADPPPTAPRVVATYPRDATTDASPIGELVVVFDRPMDATTVVGTSFDVLVEGVPPTVDPPPEVLSIEQPFGGSVPEPRVFLWRSESAQGVVQPLPVGASVEVTLSPASGTVIADADGEALAETAFSFTVADFAPPDGAAIQSSGPSEPADAIGIAALDGTAPLMILVDLAEAATDGDVLDVSIFGTRTDGSGQVAMLSRSVPIPDAATQVLLDAQDLDLAATTTPLAPRLADGDIAFAFGVRRGTRTSPVRLLDVDPATPGIQDPVQDTKAPSLVGLGFEGDTLDLRSDQRDVVVVGLADEKVRAALVEATLSAGSQTNGTVPDAVGARADGTFVAAPVAVGALDPAEGSFPITVTVFDRALNPSPAVAGTYEQLGVSGFGAVLPGPPVVLRVFDATTLAPVAGAQVFAHQDVSGAVTHLAGSPVTTDAAGAASAPSATTGDTLITIDAPGYELFTFEGVPAARLDVPLMPTGLAAATEQVLLVSEISQLELLDVAVSDPRLPVPGPTTVASSGCFFNPFTQLSDCSFAPFVVRPSRAGALSAFATNPLAGDVSGFAAAFLKAFQLELPLPPVDEGAISATSLTFPFLLDDLGIDPEEAAIDVPAQTLLGGAAIGGLDTANLAGAPSVSVQGLSPGLPGAVTVGLGSAFATGTDWTVRAAYPGAVDGIDDGGGDELGALVRSGTIEADLFLAVELVDANGNRAGVRRRLSTLGGTLDPPDVPAVTLVSIVPGDGDDIAYSVNFTDGLADADGMGGIYRVRVVDSAGRGWTLWRLDTPDAAGAGIRALFPDVAAVGGTGLAAGALLIDVALYAWPAFDPGSATGGFLWSDLEREPVLLSRTAATSFGP